MLVLRSLLFNIYIYGVTAALAIFGTLTLALPRRYTMGLASLWGKLTIFGQRVIAGTNVEVRGTENIPKGRALIACKHQSVWETASLFTLLDDPAYVLKKELSYIPFFGWMVRKARAIFVDRGAQAKALRSLVTQSEQRLEEGRPLIIFPEGTRAEPGVRGHYKPGVAALYSKLDVPCVPVALNSGLFWPRRKFLRRPGTIVVEFLPPIDPGMRSKSFLQKLEDDIETASQRLHEEGLSQLNERAA